MTELDDLITRYLATWNEPDRDARRKLISNTWSDQAKLYNRASEYHGQAAIEEAVKLSYDAFIARGFLFRAQDQSASHHGAVRFTWEMITLTDSRVDSIGTQFLMLDDDGRIRLDYQFIEKPPTA